MKAYRHLWLAALVVFLFGAMIAVSSSCSLFGGGDDDDDDDDDDDSEDPMDELNCNVAVDSSNAPLNMIVSLMCSDQNLNGVTPEEVDVKIYESTDGSNWTEITIDFWLLTEDISVASTLDYSGSMDGKLDELEDAVTTFYDMYKSGDRGEIVKFSSTFDVVQPFTGDKDALISAIEATWPEAYKNTALYDSVLVVGNDTHREEHPFAAISFSDGGENSSRLCRNVDALIDHLQLLGVPVFTIGLTGSDFTQQTEQEMMRIADETGGFYSFTPNEAELAMIYLKIAGIITGGVTISWGSSNNEEGGQVYLRFEVDFTANGQTFTTNVETSYNNPTKPDDDDDPCTQMTASVVGDCGVAFINKDDQYIDFTDFIAYCEAAAEELEVVGLTPFFQCMYDCAQDACDMECMLHNCMIPDPPGDGGCADTVADLTACGYSWRIYDTLYPYPPLDFMAVCEDLGWIDWTCAEACNADNCPGDIQAAADCLDTCYTK